MSLFIAGEAFDSASDFSAAKLAIFIASFMAGLPECSSCGRERRRR
jgi:Na+/H+ antiporter NhaA